MPPIPMTTTISPATTWATLVTAPQPVDTAQPTSVLLAGGIPVVLITCEARTVTCDANDDTFAYERTSDPRHRNGNEGRP